MEGPLILVHGPIIPFSGLDASDGWFTTFCREGSCSLIRTDKYGKLVIIITILSSHRNF